MQHEFTLEQRKAAYEYALENTQMYICIRLADKLLDGFSFAPWCQWGAIHSGYHACIDYFPELKSQNVMPDSGPCGEFTPKQRKQILTKAIKLCTTNSSNPTASTSTP